MRYLMLNKVDGAYEQGAPPDPAVLARMGQFIEETSRSGVLLQTAGLLPTAAGAMVSVRQGRVSVMDGPFTEAKEVIGGLAVIQAADREEAVQWAVRFAEVLGGDVEVEVRALADPPDGAL